MKKLERKHPLAIRWFHWINFPVLTIMIWSGLLIYWANDVYSIGPIPFIPAGVYTRLHIPSSFHLFPDQFYNGLHIGRRLAEGSAWHFLFMWFFGINGLLYVLYTAISGEWRYLVPNRQSFSEALDVVLHDLYLSRKPLPRRKFNGAQQIAYTSIILMGVGSLITGVAIYKPVQAAWLTALCGGYETARFLHFWLMMGYCGFFLIHITQVIKAGWNNFRAMVTGYELVDVEPAPVVPTTIVEEAA